MDTDTITFLLGAYGIWTWIFFAICVVLGVFYAKALWFVDSDQLVSLQAERRELEVELLDLRQKLEWQGGGFQPPERESGSETEGAGGDLIVEAEDAEEGPLDTSGPCLDAGEITDLAMGGASALIDDLSAPDSVDYEAAVASHFVGDRVRIDPQLGIIFREEPDLLDPLRMIKGVGPRVERDLNELGVFRFKQIAHWSRKNSEAFHKALDQHGVQVDRHRWLPQARDLWPLFDPAIAGAYRAPEEVDHESKILTEFPGEDVVADPDLGIVYPEPPELGDELHRIQGIGPLIQEALHNAGIFRFKQIASWSRLNVIKAGQLVERSPERIANEKWIPQARRLHWEVYSASPEWGSGAPTLSDYSRKIQRHYAKETVRPDGDLGVIYKAPPEYPDGLTQIRGVSEELAEKLNSLGVWRFRQVADWSEANVRAFANRLGVARDRIYQEYWIPQAWELGKLARKKAAFTGESFRTDPKLGIVYYQPPDSPDDLTQIEGITPQTAEILAGQGVFTLKQIALWEPENIRAFAEISGMPKNEIMTNRWVSQADMLHFRKYGTEL